METFKELLEDTVTKHGRYAAFTLKDSSGEHHDISYIRFYEEILSLGEALLKNGFDGSRIAMTGSNSYAWFLVNAAVQVSGCVSVPLDKDLKYEEFEGSLARAEVKVVFYGKKQKDLVARALRSDRTSLEKAYALYDCDLPNISDLLDEGKMLRDSGSELVAKISVDPDEVKTMIFTSGTTSRSKIVMLSQKNIVSNVEAMLSAITFSEEDTNIALLPYHHTFGSTGQWVMLANGVRTVYCDGLKHLQKNLIEYGVSVFIGVPLLVETMYKKIIKTAEKQGLGGRLRRMRKLCRISMKVGIDMRRTIFKGVLDSLGGRLRLVVLGAAAADPEVIEGFNDFGITCIQGYGLTEASPVLSAELPGAMRAGSIGRPFPGIEMDIADADDEGIGEIIARGDNIMKGYYGDPEATAAVLKDGWFYTGDLGRRDSDGYYYITGRKKNVIVLRNGKNVFPEELEQQISALPYVVENIVVGVIDDGNEKDPVVAAKVVYDPKFFPGKNEDEIHDAVKDDIEKINDGVPSYKRIRRVFVSDEPMEKTSTGKIKRYLYQ
jgi:long-chain acyl-CoA synthetase